MPIKHVFKLLFKFLYKFFKFNIWLYKNHVIRCAEKHLAPKSLDYFVNEK